MARTLIRACVEFGMACEAVHTSDDMAEAGESHGSKGEDSGDLFNPEDYCRQFCSLDMSTADPTEVPSLKARLDIIRDLYAKSGLKDVRVLEYGGGPSVYSLISAVPYSREIVFSEYDGQSRDMVQKWRDGEANHHFTTLFEYVVKSVERLSNTEVSERENALRRLMTGVYPGDLSKEIPIEMENPGLFDVISTHFTVHTVCMSVDDYVAAVDRLAKFIKPGGVLILSELLEVELGSWTELAQGKKGFELTRDAIVDCLKRLGFVNIDDRLVEKEPSESTFGMSKMITLMAQKPRD